MPNGLKSRIFKQCILTSSPESLWVLENFRWSASGMSKSSKSVRICLWRFNFSNKIPFWFVSGHESPKVFGILDQSPAFMMSLPFEKRVKMLRFQTKYNSEDTKWKRIGFRSWAMLLLNADRMPIMSFMLDDCMPFSVVTVMVKVD